MSTTFSAEAIRACRTIIGTNDDVVVTLMGEVIVKESAGMIMAGWGRKMVSSKVKSNQA